MNTKPAGYSMTPLSRKLGLKPGTSVRVVNGPHDFWDKVGLAPETFELVQDASCTIDWQQAFVQTAEDLERQLPSLRQAMHDTAVLWVGWPKGGRAERGEITRETVREIVLRTDLVDVKVCAFDENWSALKFVIRKSART